MCGSGSDLAWVFTTRSQGRLWAVDEPVGDTAVSTQVLASKLRLRVLVVPELSGRGEG